MKKFDILRKRIALWMLPKSERIEYERQFQFQRTIHDLWDLLADNGLRVDRTSAIVTAVEGLLKRPRPLVLNAEHRISHYVLRDLHIPESEIVQRIIQQYARDLAQKIVEQKLFTLTASTRDDGSLGYERVLRFSCTVIKPLPTDADLTTNIPTSEKK